MLIFCSVIVFLTITKQTYNISILNFDKYNVDTFKYRTVVCYVTLS